MEKLIITLATMVVNHTYASLLAEDLKDYSAKEKKEAYRTLLDMSKEKTLTSSQKSWLLANTNC